MISFPDLVPKPDVSQQGGSAGSATFHAHSIAFYGFKLWKGRLRYCSCTTEKTIEASGDASMDM